MLYVCLLIETQTAKLKRIGEKKENLNGNGYKML